MCPRGGGTPSKVIKWKVDNSWGTMPKRDEAPVFNGHQHMYDDFFRKYVYQVTVPKDMLSEELKKKLGEI